MTDTGPSSFVPLDLDRVRAALGSPTPWRLTGFPVATSTNDIAAELAEAGEPHGAVVLAEAQTKGRGRMQRSWHSPPGVGLWMSLLLRPRIRAGEAYGITVAAAVAAARAAQSVAGADLSLKWPNDLVGRLPGGGGAWLKVGGLLAEGRSRGDDLEWAVVGIGINVLRFPGPLPAEIAGRACAVADLATREFTREALLSDFLREVDAALSRLGSEGLAALLPEFRERSVLLGNRVDVAAGEERIVGTAREIAGDGALVVALDDGSERRVLAGEATLAPRPLRAPAPSAGRPS